MCCVPHGCAKKVHFSINARQLMLSDAGLPMNLEEAGDGKTVSNIIFN